jgi:putative DNA methylase
LKSDLDTLQSSNIAPVDLAQSAIGPGMKVYSQFSQVLEADGTPMSVRTALEIINQELDLYFNEQDGDLDRDSRFCVDLYTQNAVPFAKMDFGDADILARAKNTSVGRLAVRGILHSQKSIVRLHNRSEIPEKIEHDSTSLWLLTQQLTRALETGKGVQEAAQIISNLFGANGEKAKALAYRLFTIAEHKGWAQEAFAYNALVVAWPEIQAAVSEIQSQVNSAAQLTLND